MRSKNKQTALAAIIGIIIFSAFKGWVLSPLSLLFSGCALLYYVYRANNREKRAIRRGMYFIAYRSFPMINAQRLRVILLGMAVVLFVLLGFLGILLVDESILKTVFILTWGNYFTWYTLKGRQEVEPFDSRIARIYPN